MPVDLRVIGFIRGLLTSNFLHMRNTQTISGAEFENYSTAVSLAQGYLAKHGIAEFQFGSFDDLVESFLSYIEAMD